MYYSETFVKKVGNATFFLLGDAAGGVPFFKSFNKFGPCALVLGERIGAYFKDPELQSTIFDEYNEHVTYVAHKAGVKAILKGSLITSVEYPVYGVQSSVHLSKGVIQGSGRALQKLSKEALHTAEDMVYTTGALLAHTADTVVHTAEQMSSTLPFKKRASVDDEADFSHWEPPKCRIL